MTPPSLRALMWVWVGLASAGASGAATLQALGPLPLPVPSPNLTTATEAPLAADSQAGTALTPAVTPAAAPAPIWPATAGAGTMPAVETAPRSPPAVSHSSAPHPIRVTVIPPMPPSFARETHRTREAERAPGPRRYAKLALRPPHFVPHDRQERVVTYSYAETEEPVAEPVYTPPPGYGWRWGPRAYQRPAYYGYYPDY